ncbi:hypothetical protein C7M52_00661 [Mixta theicola]|nr:hypothetical protein [Mixta theicola]QHM74719.1 hypothetical protein C7M52_00661 [Mixta theicola]
MKPLPLFPVWKTATPPATKKWLAAGSLITLLTGGGTALLQHVYSGNMIFAAMIFMLLIIGGLWLCRLVYYRASLHHATVWNQTVEHEHYLWWEKHKSPLALSEIYLTGPAGSATIDWIRLLNHEQRAPAVRQETNGKTLRIARTFSADTAEREQQLAHSLVLCWKKGHRNPVPPLARCYWHGSEAAWLAFYSQMKDSFPEVELPASPQAWHGEATLSEMAMLLRADKEKHFLVAGCHSCAASSDALRPAGESAVLWLVGADGDVVMPCGEFFDLSGQDVMTQVCQRALQQSELEDIPEACILFSHPCLTDLADGGWNITHHLQDNYWGNLGSMEQLVVISLAAILARHQNQPCGWVAPDPLHTLALGIIKPYGKG